MGGRPVRENATRCRRLRIVSATNTDQLIVILHKFRAAGALGIADHIRSQIDEIEAPDCLASRKRDLAADIHRLHAIFEKRRNRRDAA